MSDPTAPLPEQQLAEEIAKATRPSYLLLDETEEQRAARILPLLTATFATLREERDALRAQLELQAESANEDHRLRSEERDFQIGRAEKAKRERDQAREERDHATRAAKVYMKDNGVKIRAWLDAEAEARRLSEMLEEAKGLLKHALSIWVDTNTEAYDPKVLEARAFLAKPTAAPVEPPSWKACPEHGPHCSGAGCCCADKHPQPPPTEAEEGPMFEPHVCNPECEPQEGKHRFYLGPKPPIEAVEGPMQGEIINGDWTSGPCPLPNNCHALRATNACRSGGRFTLLPLPDIDGTEWCHKTASDPVHADRMLSGEPVVYESDTAPVHQVAEPKCKHSGNSCTWVASFRQGGDCGCRCEWCAYEASPPAPVVAAEPAEGHDVLCSEGQYAGDQVMPCDCDGPAQAHPPGAGAEPSEGPCIGCGFDPCDGMSALCPKPAPGHLPENAEPVEDEPVHYNCLKLWSGGICVKAHGHKGDCGVG